MKKISEFTIKRLSIIYSLFNNINCENRIITSKVLAQYLNTTPDTIRKDISLLGYTSKSITNGYEINELKLFIEERFGLNEEIKICVIGLGKIGRALLEDERLKSHPFKIEAAFDKNLNKLEIIKSDIPLYHIQDLEKVINENNIKVALLCIGKNSIQKMVERLIKAGIKLIINLTPSFIGIKENSVIIKNINIATEILSGIAQLNLKKSSKIT